MKYGDVYKHKEHGGMLMCVVPTFHLPLTAPDRQWAQMLIIRPYSTTGFITAVTVDTLNQYWKKL